MCTEHVLHNLIWHYGSFSLIEDVDLISEYVFVSQSHVGNKLQEGLQGHFQEQIFYASRIGAVVEPHENLRDCLRYFDDLATGFQSAWSYIDTRYLWVMPEECYKQYHNDTADFEGDS